MRRAEHSTRKKKKKKKTAQPAGPKTNRKRTILQTTTQPTGKTNRPGRQLAIKNKNSVVQNTLLSSQTTTT
ncbi:hypothetical protein, partial [Bifidobacterium sp. SMB2]|uniref:hypothetical protein n=1 Tax=Bifidobacterium sp. SMB2 TaxID=2661626 RepID=UPI001952F962